MGVFDVVLLSERSRALLGRFAEEFQTKYLAGSDGRVGFYAARTFEPAIRGHVSIELRCRPRPEALSREPMLDRVREEELCLEPPDVAVVELRAWLGTCIGAPPIGEEAGIRRHPSLERVETVRWSLDIDEPAVIERGVLRFGRGELRCGGRIVVEARRVKCVEERWEAVERELPARRWRDLELVCEDHVLVVEARKEIDLRTAQPGAIERVVDGLAEQLLELVTLLARNAIGIRA